MCYGCAMKPLRMIRVFTDRFPLVGPSFWIASIQYYLVQLVVMLAWMAHFSLASNTISDLGNTNCGLYNGRYICSPLHALMNASFVVLGATMMIGAVLVYQEFRETEGSLVGFSFMGLAGAGTILVGLFPENSVSSLHFIGALLPFLVGNIGLIVLGAVLDLPKTLKLYTLLSGVISLLALGFYLTHYYLGLGPGGMERLVAYPQTMWLIVFGIYLSRNHFRTVV